MPDLEYSSLIFGAGFLGMLHALEADHVATVSTLILERHPWKRTVGLALRWALGHSLTLFVLAAAALLAKAVFANVSLGLMERVAGLSMVYIGVLFLFRERHRRQRPQDFESGPPSRRGWALFGLGVLHGTAGWSSIFLLVPVALFESRVWVLGYIGMFCLGMILTMAVYASLVNRLTAFQRVGGHLGKLRCVSAAITLTIGLRLLWASGL